MIPNYHYRSRETIQAFRVPIESQCSESEFMQGHGAIAGWMMGKRVADWRVSDELGYSVINLDARIEIVRPGDYIVCSASGYIYALPASIFEERYEPVENQK